MRLKSMRSTMVLRIWGVSALLFAVAMVVDFVFTKGKVEDAIEENAVNLARFYGKKFDALFVEGAIVTRMMAVHVIAQGDRETDGADRERSLTNVVYQALAANPVAYGLGFAFEPHAFSMETERFGPYFRRDGGTFLYEQMGALEDYDYFEQPWYSEVRQTGFPMWTRPYLDEIPMITHAYPLRRDGVFEGVALVDISLASITEKISAISLLESGYGFAVSRCGALLSELGPDHRSMETNIRDLSPRLADKIVEIDSLPSGQWIVLESPDPVRYEPAQIVMLPVRYNGIVIGTIGLVYPMDEVRARIYDLQKESAIVGVLGLILLLLIVMAVSNTLARPVSVLVGGASRIAKGDLDYKLSDISSISEVVRLRDAFNKMSDDLKNYLQELQENVAARERVESELQIARHIQSSMLPRIFPPFPDRTEFNLHAVMEPAREVGGDFYDFFFITPEKLCLVIGDVSGKGIPAALFMVIAKALLRMEAMNDLPPEQILKRVNNHLCPDNPESMFVTVFCAILDTATGELLCANAGHNPPLVSRTVVPDAVEVENMEVNRNLVLGVVPDIDYKPDRIMLTRNDALILYTDGITEAMDRDSNQFTEQRLKQVVAANHNVEMRTLVKRVQSAVTAFVDGAEQSDDITMLALRYKGV